MEEEREGREEREDEGEREGERIGEGAGGREGEGAGAGAGTGTDVEEEEVEGARDFSSIFSFISRMATRILALAFVQYSLKTHVHFLHSILPYPPVSNDVNSHLFHLLWRQ